MDVSAIHSALPRLVEGLKRFGARRVILFGSAARGDADAASDLDIIVVAPTDRPFAARLGDVVAFIPPDCPQVDVLVYTPDEYGRMLAAGHPFLTRAVADGRVLYEA
ncbi:MAG: nucleotidyltransferase domain-containing protein [bacterium]